MIIQFPMQVSFLFVSSWQGFFLMFAIFFLREKPERLFEVFMEVAKPDGQGEGKKMP